jgi:hypothetical protein
MVTTGAGSGVGSGSGVGAGTEAGEEEGAEGEEAAAFGFCICRHCSCISWMC